MPKGATLETMFFLLFILKYQPYCDSNIYLSSANKLKEKKLQRHVRI